MRLRQLEAQLIDLRGRYTDEHPDVIQTQSQIARLREQLGDAPASDGQPAADPLVPPALSQSLEQVQLEISRLKQDDERAKKAIEVYQARVENAFVREQELQGLTRDYDVTRKKYQTLLSKKLEAQLSQSLERRQKAERFRVLDPASRPQVPTRPNRQLLTLGGAGASIAIALFLPILLWQLDSSFHLPEECVASGLPVLGVISRVRTQDVDRRLRRYRIQVLGFSALGLIVGLGTATMYAKFVF
jgi:protein tyrosine kinase modulator